MSNLLTTTLKLREYGSSEGVYLLSQYMPANTHEELYLKVREKEDRILPDALVKILPFTSSNFPYHKEWKLRDRSANQFCDYLNKKTGANQILDLGCGNGWFSKKIASIQGKQVIGLDLNLPELKQAQRLFGGNNLIFCYGNIEGNLFDYESFDLITLNASIQYFQSIEKLINILLKLLKPMGEIHILDSPFYEVNEVENARKRTVDYYTLIGYPEMGLNYFHHTFQSLKNLSPNHKTIKNTFLGNFIKRHQNPFPWVIIKRQ